MLIWNLEFGIFVIARSVATRQPACRRGRSRGNEITTLPEPALSVAEWARDDNYYWNLEFQTKNPRLVGRGFLLYHLTLF